MESQQGVKDMVTVQFTEDEAELVILALDDFRRHGLQDYDDKMQPEISAQLKSAATKVRDA